MNICCVRDKTYFSQRYTNSSIQLASLEIGYFYSSTVAESSKGRNVVPFRPHCCVHSPKFQIIYHFCCLNFTNTFWNYDHSNRRWFVFICAMLENMLFAAPLFGWASLRQMLMDFGWKVCRNYTRRYTEVPKLKFSPTNA